MLWKGKDILSLKQALIRQHHLVSAKAAPEDCILSARHRLHRGHRARDVVDEGRARLDARLPPEGPRNFERRPMPTWGGDMSEIYFDDIFYYIKPTDHRWTYVGRPARRDQEHLREARHPRGRAQVPRGRRPRSTKVKSSSTATAKTSSAWASSSATWTPRCASTPSW